MKNTSIYCLLVLFFLSCGSLTLTGSAAPALAASNGLSGEEKLQRALLHHQKAKEKALEYQGTEGMPLAQQLAAALPFPLVETYPTDNITLQGIMDLAWDGAYLWGIDGGALEDTCYVDKIYPSTFTILEYFEAPGERLIAHGVSGIACARGYLWVLNFLDNVIYAVEPTTPSIDPEKTIILPAFPNVISGGCYDGEHLWFAEWGSPAQLHKVDIDGKTIIKDIPLPGYRYADDLTYMRGSLWVTVSETDLGPTWYLRVDPDSGSIQGRYEKPPCSSGITFTGRYLIVANWYEDRYYKYDTEPRIAPPAGDGDGCFIGTILPK